MATVTLYELGSYNGGILITSTFDLAESPTYEDWLESVGRWLQRLTNEIGVLCEEWIVADVEDVPSQYVGEYTIDERYWHYREAVDNSCLDEEIFSAASELDIAPEMVEELYQGEYDLDRTFAYSLAEELGALQEVQWPYTCIDWDHAARELMHDYGQSGGHYFRTSY